MAMFVPDQKPDEITAHDPVARAWPFIEIHGLLHARGVRVPRILGEDCDAGLLLLEDLTDLTLARFLESNEAARTQAYRQAVEDLADAQSRLSDLPPDSVVATRAFDGPLLEWELQHFREFALEAQGITLAAEERDRFNRIAHDLASEIAGWPRGFVHRDYQSRNLMVRRTDAGGFQLVWIDFQDALLGPNVYDLVALLNDSYQKFTPEFVHARIEDFAKARGLSSDEAATLRTNFFRMTVQRKLKDAGRFVFIDRVKGNPAFLPFIRSSLSKVRTAIDYLPSSEDLHFIRRLVDRAAEVAPPEHLRT